MRNFKTGAVRDTSNNKISYYGFRHPLVEHSYGKYMLRHREQADGKLRSPNNWWGGWSEDTSIDSLARHVADLECLHAGLFVYKVRTKDGEATEVFTKKQPLKKGWTEVNKEESYNAIKFNCNSGLLRYLS
ncbi:MAG: hypothetical protein PF488_00505 [Patescibacteria group bacterium]|jgi:hypothetical protein|nr:hypothetical protein [Patescibacteria group bacterium]